MALNCQACFTNACTNSTGALLTVCTNNGSYTADSSGCTTYTGIAGGSGHCFAGQTWFRHSAYLWGRARSISVKEVCCNDFLGCAGCSLNEVNGPTAALIYGRITDCNTTVKIVGATVELRKGATVIASDTTDINGDYSFDACALDLQDYPYDVCAVATGYDETCDTADPGADPG